MSLRFLKIFPIKVRSTNSTNYEIYHTETGIKVVQYQFRLKTSANLCAQELETKYDFSFTTAEQFQDPRFSGEDPVKMCREIKDICRRFDV